MLTRIIDRVRDFVESKRSIGSHYEQLAFHYLQKQGLRLITQNYHCREGEIDLIMKHFDVLVFVEVRYRQNTTFGSAEQSITLPKQRRIILAAEHYLLKNERFRKFVCRFDVVAIHNNGDNIKWIQDAFQCED